MLLQDYVRDKCGFEFTDGKYKETLRGMCSYWKKKTEMYKKHHTVAEKSTHDGDDEYLDKVHQRDAADTDNDDEDEERAKSDYDDGDDK